MKQSRGLKIPDDHSVPGEGDSPDIHLRPVMSGAGVPIREASSTDNRSLHIHSMANSRILKITEEKLNISSQFFAKHQFTACPQIFRVQPFLRPKRKVEDTKCLCFIKSLFQKKLRSAIFL